VAEVPDGRRLVAGAPASLVQLHLCLDTFADADVVADLFERVFVERAAEKFAEEPGFLLEGETVVMGLSDWAAIPSR